MTTMKTTTTTPRQQQLFLVSLIVATSTMVANAWSLTGSQSSAFTGRPFVVSDSFGGSSLDQSCSLLMYDSRRDPPNDGGRGGKSSSSPPNFWNVLSTTEKWISNTLHSSNAGTGGQNPYSRKEVSYACEASGDSAMIVANLFRRLKEARELGEKHGQQEMARAEQVGSSYQPSTLRQTQVVVIPGNDEFCESFPVFNEVIEAVNQARRHARDYVTEAHWERMDSAEDEDDMDEEWAVAVNCAHLHPKFGQKTPAQELAELQAEEENGEVDVHYEEYKKKRLLARQSPYPTVVIEVRATPPPDFGAAAPPPPSMQAAKDSSSSSGEDDAVTAADIMKLEQLFGKSAHMNHPTKHTTSKQEEEAFYSSIGESIQELSAVTPLVMAQNYMAAADPTIPATAAFTESNTATVDEAYEFVFTNIAMMVETVKQQEQQRYKQEQQQQDVRHYVVMPRFVTSAATSLEKFARQCNTILDTVPDLANKIYIQTFHPEHVQEAQRSPMPILMLQWKHDG